MSLCRLAAAAVSGALAAGAWGGEPAAGAGSARMAEYLARVARSADPVANIYLNRARAEGIRSLLDRPMPPAREMRLRVTIARELLRGGRFREAGDELELVTREIEQQGLPAEESFLRMLRDLRAIAALRAGEEESGRRPAHGWVFPMERGGGAPFDAGAREAIALYSENLRGQPGDLATRWLLNIAFMTLGEYPEGVPADWRLPPEAFAPEYPVGRFTGRGRRGRGRRSRPRRRQRHGGSGRGRTPRSRRLLPRPAGSAPLLPQPRRRHLRGPHPRSRPHRPARGAQPLPRRLRQRRRTAT